MTFCGRCTDAPASRRDFLRQVGGGLGGVAISYLLHEQGLAAALEAEPHAPKLHHPAKAKAVIQLFMLGGASQCDTFDYKPELIKRHGQKVDFRVTGGTVASPG